MEKRDNGYKIIAVIALVLAVAGLSVAYASFSASLNVSGTATVSTKWDIKWTDLSGNATNYATAGNLTIQTGDQTINGTVGELVAPGDSVTWTWKATNAGNIDAKLTGASLPTISCAPATGSTVTASDATSFCSDLELKLYYGEGANKKEVTGSNTASLTSALDAGSSVPVEMTITYKSDSTSTISGAIDVTVTGTPTLTYAQD